jgi:hypothetical protein
MYTEQDSRTANHVRSFEHFAENAHFIRHLQVHGHAMDPLNQMLFWRGLRPLP